MVDKSNFFRMFAIHKGYNVLNSHTTQMLWLEPKTLSRKVIASNYYTTLMNTFNHKYKLTKILLFL